MGLEPLHEVGLVMAFDPGKVNFAFVLYDENGVGEHGLIEGAEDVGYLPYFRLRLLRKLRRYQPNVVFIERYHSRPGAGAILNMELANLMIGVVFEQCSRLRIPCNLVTAATHKNWAFRELDVPTKTVTRKGKQKEIHDLEAYHEYEHLATEHEVDAANLAKYGYEKLRKELKENAEETD